MVTACLRGGDVGRVSPLWLIGCYVLLSLAELLLAPMSLSLITQLAPPNQTARMVGLWLATVALGNALANIGLGVAAAALGTGVLGQAIAAALSR